MVDQVEKTTLSGFVDQVKDLPGTDLLRSIVLVLLATGFLIGILESPSPIPSYFKYLSVYSSVFVIFCTGTSMVQSIKLPTYNDIGSLSAPKVFFYPKITVSIGVLVFFIIICIWVVLLGGVVKSPFGPVLSLSPIFFVLEFIRKEDLKKYKKLMEYFIAANGGRHKANIEIQRFGRYVKAVRILEFLPIIIILFTIIFGELTVYFYQFHLYLLKCDSKVFATLIQADWFTLMSYTLYYSSITATAIGILPRDLRGAFFDKFVKKIYS